MQAHSVAPPPALSVKRRVVLRGPTLAKTVTIPPLPGYLLLSIDPELTPAVDAYHELVNQLGRARLEARLRHTGVHLYLISDANFNRVAGYYWAAVGRSAELWHDNFLIPKGAALLFNALVLPEYRRRGLYTRLIAAAHHHLLTHVHVNEVYTIVEAQNHASLEANRRAGGQDLAVNHLVKVFGRNVLSIYRGMPGGRLQVHYVLSGPKSHRF